MTEEQKEALKEKLKKFFDEKMDSLTNKFQTDINELETLKYSYFDNVVIPFREMQESGKHQNESEEIKEKEEKKEEKIKEITKLNVPRPKTAAREKLSKTPFKSNKTKEIGFKDKTEHIPKKTTKIFSGKKNQKSEPTATQPNEGNKRKTITSSETNKKGAANRASKTPFSSRGRKGDAGTTQAKAKNSKGTAIKTITTKKFTGKGKAGDKKGKNEKKKKENEEAKEEEVVEEKKPIVLKDKSINKIPEELKSNNSLINLYFVLKGKYLNNKDKYKLILSNPSIYKSFGSDIKFLLDDKKKELKSKITELESFLNNYGDLKNYLSKEFNPSKTAQNSLVFVKKEEIEKIIKKGNIEVEINNIFRLLLHIFDEPFDESLENENLLNFFVTEIMTNKYNAKDLKTVALNYISKHKDLNNSKEKYEKIEAIISQDKRYISSIDMAKAKINRIASYCTLLIKECHEFINLKTLDNVPYYELKLKNKMLQEYKNKLATIENNGVPPENKEEEKKDEPPKENKDTEKKEEVKKDEPPKENNDNEKKEEEKKDEPPKENNDNEKKEEEKETLKVQEESVTKEKEG